MRRYPPRLLHLPHPPHRPLRRSPPHPQPRFFVTAALLCVLLSTGTAAASPPAPAAAPAARQTPESEDPPGTGPATPAAAAQRSAFHRVLQQAEDTARAGNFDSAAASAQQAYAKAADPYERIRAADWYASIREKQGRYGQARQALRTIRPLIRCAYGSHDMARSMAQEARLAFLQNRRAEAYALLAAIRDIPLSAPALAWGQMDRDDWIPQGRRARLYYRLAGMSFPGMAGGLLREEYKTADDRADSSTLIYTPIALQGPLEGMKVRLRLGSRDRHATTIVQELMHELSYERGLYGDKPHEHEAGTALRPGPVPAEFAPAGSAHAAGATNLTGEQGNEEVHGVWIARKGAWQIVIRASWAPARQAAAAQALRALFADIGWNANKALYRGLSPRAQALQRQFDAALANRQWAAAAALARRLLPGAVFPADQARLYSAMGIAAARDGKPAQAVPLLRKALEKWRYSKLEPGSEPLFEALLQHAAETMPGDAAALAAAGKAAAALLRPVPAGSSPAAAGAPRELSCAAPAMAATPGLH